jgi:hypothetical protein
MGAMRQVPRHLTISASLLPTEWIMADEGDDRPASHHADGSCFT